LKLKNVSFNVKLSIFESKMNEPVFADEIASETSSNKMEPYDNSTETICLL
jgi:hypothetical protein